MPAPILFLGDTSLDTAACYLAGCLTHAGWKFQYRRSDELLLESDLQQPLSLIIVSDYPAANITDALQQQIIQQVEAGTGLLMIGGWESFQGSDGHWSGTPIGDILPVLIDTQDDRQNCDSPVFAKPTSEDSLLHPVLSGLPWLERPPLIGGYNRVQAKADCKCLLLADRYSVTFDSVDDSQFEGCNRISRDPLLVVNQNGEGRIAAMMTDLAPHWIGPMVDWGTERVQAQAPEAEGIEVGSNYVQFVQQLISWCGRLED